MRELYRNPEVKSIFLKLLIFQIMFIVFITIYINFMLEGLNKSFINNNIAIAGKILYKHPSLEGDIVSLFTKEATSEEINKGEKVLVNYGYSEKTSIVFTPVMNKFYKTFRNKFIILIIVAFILLFLLVVWESKKIFKKIVKIAIAAEKVVEGDFSIELKEDGEGDFAILAHAFNEMSNRLQLSLHKLQGDKEFLKNIISDISHQLKTPLSSLIIFNDLLLSEEELNVQELNVKDLNKRNVNKKDRVQFLERSRQQLNRMEWLIINLLKMARIEAGAIKFNIKNTPVILPLNQALSSLNIKLVEKNQNIKIVEQEGACFKVDEKWTCEAFTNIIKNSIEHTGEGGTITIEFNENPLFTKVCIKDNGEGISTDDLAHVFERFYKSKENIKEDSIGIGLFMSKSIIESQGGTISVKSNKGQGTEFIICFLKSVI